MFGIPEDSFRRQQESQFWKLGDNNPGAFLFVSGIRFGKCRADSFRTHLEYFDPLGIGIPLNKGVMLPKNFACRQVNTGQGLDKYVVTDVQ